MHSNSIERLFEFWEAMNEAINIRPIQKWY